MSIILYYVNIYLIIHYLIFRIRYSVYFTEDFSLKSEIFIEGIVRDTSNKMWMVYHCAKEFIFYSAL